MAHEPGTNQLISQDELARYLEVVFDADIDTDRLDQMINHASSWIENYLGRKFRSATDLVERFNGNGRKRKYLTNAPIVVVSPAPIVERWEGTELGWIDVVAVHLWSFDNDATQGLIWWNDGNIFSKGDENWRITYDYGYTLKLVPDDLKMACYILTEHFGNLHRVAGKKSVRFGEETTTFARENPQINRGNIPTEAIAILERFRRYTSG